MSVCTSELTEYVCEVSTLSYCVFHLLDRVKKVQQDQKGSLVLKVTRQVFEDADASVLSLSYVRPVLTVLLFIIFCPGRQRGVRCTRTHRAQGQTVIEIGNCFISWRNKKKSHFPYMITTVSQSWWIQIYTIILLLNWLILFLLNVEQQLSGCFYKTRMD